MKEREGRGGEWWWCGRNTQPDKDEEDEMMSSHEFRPLKVVNDLLAEEGVKIKQFVAANNHLLILDGTHNIHHNAYYTTHNNNNT